MTFSDYTLLALRTCPFWLWVDGGYIPSVSSTLTPLLSDVEFAYVRHIGYLQWSDYFRCYTVCTVIERQDKVR